MLPGSTTAEAVCSQPVAAWSSKPVPFSSFGPRAQSKLSPPMLHGGLPVGHWQTPRKSATLELNGLPTESSVEAFQGRGVFLQSQGDADVAERGDRRESPGGGVRDLKFAGKIQARLKFDRQGEFADRLEDAGKEVSE